MPPSPGLCSGHWDPQEGWLSLPSPSPGGTDMTTDYVVLTVMGMGSREREVFQRMGTRWGWVGELGPWRGAGH